MKRISTQLIISFLIIALLPTLPLSLVVKDLLERRFGPAIADPLEQALASGLKESRVHLDELKTSLGIRGMELAANPFNRPVYLLSARGQVQSPDSLTVFLSRRPGISEQFSDLEIFESGASARPDRLADTLALRLRDSNGNTAVLLQPLPDGMVQRAGDITGAISLVKIMRGQKNQVLFSFVGPFLLVYGLLILVALAVGIVWSRQMSKPLEVLVQATRRVAQGDLEFRIKKQGPGEVGELVQSFDQMVGNLAQQHRDLARLERAAAWRGMARTLAHEVKNPLTPILLAVNQVNDCYPGEDEKYKALLEEVSEIVGEEIENLRRLVKEFGDFARLPKPELKPGDMNGMLAELVQLYGDQRLQLNSPDDLKSGPFDHNALRRAMINLIDNGLAACKEAGRPEVIKIDISQTGREVRLVIEDEGTGISPEHLDKIFEPDFTTKSGGMGLGLAIVDNIIIGHGGRIVVESETGRGTRFIITLPTAHLPGAGQSLRDGK